MYDGAIRKRALDLLATGISLNAASKELGISRFTLKEWRANPRLVLKAIEQDCPRCVDPANPAPRSNRHAYAHLLGLYLGDGHIGRLRKGVFSLRIFCDDRYPGLQQEGGDDLA